MGGVSSIQFFSSDFRNCFNFATPLSDAMFVSRCQVMQPSIHPSAASMDPNAVQLAAQMGQLQLSGTSVGDDHTTL